MKIFAFLMAIVIMVVSCAPCKDSSSMPKVGKSQSTLAQDNGHDHEGGADDCSPLCTCACCSAHSCPQSFITATGISVEANVSHSSSYNGSLISISLPIWQPPQLLA
ncbi:MAG: hypothetical protein J7621_07355 [Niastella sp.]|nr:hypothetical protein [Niastella sp.]